MMYRRVKIAHRLWLQIFPKAISSFKKEIKIVNVPYALRLQKWVKKEIHPSLFMKLSL